MSRKRKRIAAVTAMMVAVLGLGLAGYIQATRASGRDNVAGNFNGNRSHGYRLNHQVGLGDAREWYVASNPYTNTSETDSAKLVDQPAAGSNEPENGDEVVADAEAATTSDFVGGSGGGMPASAPPAAAGDAGQGSSTLRLARAFGSGFAGGAGGGSGSAGGGSGGAGNGGTQTGNGPGAENPPTSDKPTETDKPIETNPSPEEPADPEPEVFPPVVEPNPPVYVPDEPTPVSVPEPATFGLFGLGLAAVGFMRRRRNQA